MIEKVIFPEGWICNPHTPVQSKHTFSFSRFVAQGSQKGIKKPPKMEPLVTQNQKKTRKTTSQKNTKK